MQKSADAFRTISEVADDLSLPQHVLRFWETRFPQIRPLKRAGGRRYYRPADVLLLKSIRQLLYDDGYTIKGVQRLLKEQGARGLGLVARTEDAASLPGVIEGSDDQATQPADPLGDAAHFLFAPDDARLSDAHRQTIESALDIVEECRRILSAARHAR